MAKPNYQFEKRRKEMEAARKKEEKKQRKLERSNAQPEEAGSDEAAKDGQTAE